MQAESVFPDYTSSRFLLLIVKYVLGHLHVLLVPLAVLANNPAIRLSARNIYAGGGGRTRSPGAEVWVMGGGG